ncbi:hypothetical protein AB0J68_30515 [Micromonospora sp. NPDC049580]|uniref:hypothetical protein n=1 Tax=Micromonospora sp. NPDC049580 TaxID=3154832 RepID=UPI0034277982
MPTAAAIDAPTLHGYAIQVDHFALTAINCLLIAENLIALACAAKPLAKRRVVDSASRYAPAQFGDETSM